MPPILRSNTKYDFEIITYRLLTPPQKENLLKNVEERVRFLLMNNIYFDGMNVVVSKPKDVYNKLNQLINESLKHFESKKFHPPHTSAFFFSIGRIKKNRATLDLTDSLSELTEWKGMILQIKLLPIK